MKHLLINFSPPFVSRLFLKLAGSHDQSPLATISDTNVVASMYSRLWEVVVYESRTTWAKF